MTISLFHFDDMKNLCKLVYFLYLMFTEVIRSRSTFLDRNKNIFERTGGQAVHLFHVKK